MASGLNDLIEKIIALEDAIKKKYPKQAGRVKIENASQAVDYSLGPIEEVNRMEWNAKYYQELQNQL